MSQKKYFGTDGIRGRVGTSHVNPEFVLKLGWAVGRVLANSDRKCVIIGKDTRVSGYMLESALEAGLSAAGVDVVLLGPMPTPGIAYLTQTMHASAGIVISASHNPFEDNGIKFFSSSGGKLPDELEHQIEHELSKPLDTVSCAMLGKARRMNDAAGRYIEFCKSTLPSLMKLSGLKIVLDCANGATYHIAPNVYAELGAEVISMGDRPDGFNINAACGTMHPEALQKRVLQEKADLGIALDGDGDRVILVDAEGRLINGDQIIYMIVKNRLERGIDLQGVVGTLMSNYGLEKAIHGLGLQFLRTKVGDRYVLEALHENGWQLGGEPSGHVVCLDKTTTGDGIVASLQVVSCMIKQGKSLAELTAGMTLLPQTLLSVKTDYAGKLVKHPETQAMVGDIEAKLKGEGRVVLRASGTEPVLRVMVEGDSAQDVSHYAKSLCDLLEGIIL
ncbi:MAG: phosphoglucosamine mutase [Gammaproteobacteria bacterium]|nr:phosphoglucosamine mutase [Gammaproteobacteria bacterium]